MMRAAVVLALILAPPALSQGRHESPASRVKAELEAFWRQRDAEKRAAEEFQERRFPAS